MKTNKSFGECLSELLKIFNIKGSSLSRAINVDSSLIYKWLGNKRVPSYNSPYINLITSFFVNNINNSFQKEIIIETLRKWSSKELDTINVEEEIRKHLLESQGYSIELLLNKNNKRKFEVLPNTRDMTYPNETSKLDLINKNIIIEDFDSRKKLFCGTDTVNIINGNKEVLYSALNILESIPKQPCDNNDTILITFNSNMDLLPTYKEFNIKWKNALYNVLKNGWKVIYLVNLNDNVKRTIKIIEDMQLALSTGRYYIYYYKRKSDIFSANELIIVPKICALYCFSSHLKNQIDSAFFFKSKKSIEILSGHFSQIFSSAKPLLNSYPSQQCIEFHSVFTESEERLGDRYVFKGDISTITFPLDLYKKYLSLSGKTKGEIAKRLSLHKRRISAFKSQIKYYKFKEIWFKESIEKLITEKQYSFDQYYILGNTIPNNEDIIYHLENVINLLNENKNYEIALVNKSHYENLSKIYWMVKENSNVFIEAFNTNIENKTVSYNYNSEINLLISEPDAVNAFVDYFLLIWDHIDPIDRDKNQIIKWLQNKIDSLKNLKSSFH
ncbi:MAG: XRE family transcriptional regulator [Clostridium sp.]|nr:XRE family transcriptional regulator [Clostridium sp.]